MKLKFLNESTLERKSGGRSQTQPKMTLYAAGTIMFNKPAMALLEIDAGDKVSLAQDEEEPENWYVFKDPANGFALRPKSTTDLNLQFNHSVLIEQIAAAFGLDKTVTCPLRIAGQVTTLKGDKTKYWGILQPPSQV